MSCRTVLNSYHDDDDLLWKLVGVVAKFTLRIQAHFVVTGIPLDRMADITVSGNSKARMDVSFCYCRNEGCS